MALVIGGHILFAYRQWFKWPELCAKLTDLTRDEALKTAFLGRSIASYNASIAVGLALSFLLDSSAQAWVQGVTLALIVATAAVGNAGVRGSTILVARLAPAAAALAVLAAMNL